MLLIGRARRFSAALNGRVFLLHPERTRRRRSLYDLKAEVMLNGGFLRDRLKYATLAVLYIRLVRLEQPEIVPVELSDLSKPMLILLRLGVFADSHNDLRRILKSGAIPFEASRRNCQYVSTRRCRHPCPDLTLVSPLHRGTTVLAIGPRGSR